MAKSRKKLNFHPADMIGVWSRIWLLHAFVESDSSGVKTLNPRRQDVACVETGVSVAESSTAHGTQDHQASVKLQQMWISNIHRPILMATLCV